MKRNITRAAYERYLNEELADIYDGRWVDVQEDFGHMTNSKRITAAYNNRKLGTLRKNHDPIAFGVGYNEWVLKQSK